MRRQSIPVGEAQGVTAALWSSQALVERQAGTRAKARAHVRHAADTSSFIMRHYNLTLMIGFTNATWQLLTDYPLNPRSSPFAQ